MRSALMAIAVLIALTAVACGADSPSTPSAVASSGYAGRWSGTIVVVPVVVPGSGGVVTLESRAISFTVSADQRITDISVGYAFNGCSGTKVFSGLSVAIGASPLLVQGPQGWAYASPTTDGTDYTSISATFTSERTASGTTLFVEFPGCGPGGGGNWTATKQ